MDDGLFQILFIAILILASMFDAMTRGKRRRRRQMEEMERAEAEAELGAGFEGVDSATVEVPRERETADTMVPSDFWAVLTGEEAPPSSAGRPDEESAEPAWGDEPELEPPTLPEAGVPAEPHAPEPYPTESRYTPERAPPVPPPIPTTPVEVGGSAVRPSQRVHLPSALGTAPSPFKEPSFTRPTLGAGEGARSTAAAYADLLRTGGADSLRQAIVLTEVLGPPAALRGYGRYDPGSWLLEGGES